MFHVEQSTLPKYLNLSNNSFLKNRFDAVVYICYISNMNINLLRLALSCCFAITVSSSISSCAYTQLNKQVLEKATVYNGFAVELPLSLYSSQGNWYVKVRKLDVQKIKPFIHDNIVLKNGDKESIGTLKPFSHYTEYQYIRVSDGTASVLQRSDGYATLETLCDELKDSYAQGCISELADSMQHRVHAQIKSDKGSIACVAANGQPVQRPGVGTQILSKLALVVDAPCTVAYNVAMPLITPVIFFSEFLTDDSGLNNINN